MLVAFCVICFWNKSEIERNRALEDFIANDKVNGSRSSDRVLEPPSSDVIANASEVCDLITHGLLLLIIHRAVGSADLPPPMKPYDELGHFSNRFVRAAILVSSTHSHQERPSWSSRYCPMAFTNGWAKGAQRRQRIFSVNFRGFFNEIR
jgi:hypothetical protein